MANRNEAKKHFEIGNDFYQQGNYREACNSYQKATEIDPNFADAYFKWGNVLADLKKYEEAIEKYQKVIEIDTNYADAYFKWGNVLADLKRYEEAIEKYQKAIDIEANYAIAYNNWGAALADLKKYEEAIEKYQKVIEIDPNYANAHYNWGIALAGLKKYEEAIEKFRKAIDIEANYAIAYNNWGIALIKLKRYEEAIEKYQKVIKIDPNYANAHYNWGNALGDLKRYKEAIEKYQKAIQTDADYTYAYNNIAYYLWKQGKYKASYEKWENARNVFEQTKQKAKDSNNADYFYYFGYMLHGVFGELNEAEKIYNEGLELDHNHIDILTGLVNLYLEKKDEDTEEKTTAHWKAWELYKKAEGILKDQLNTAEDALTFLQLGQLHLTMEEYAEAERYLQDALEKDRESAEPYTYLGVLYTRKEDFKMAVQYFESALRRDPDNLTIRSNLAEAYLKAELMYKAEVEYKKILKITLGHVESHLGLGEVYTAMGDAEDEDMYDQAIYHFTEGIKIAQSKKGSKILRKKELAAVLYSRGYARVKLYEASKTIRDESLLHDALKDFKDCFHTDQDHHKARRAKEKIEKMHSRYSPQRLTERVGPLVISLPSLTVFILTQGSFFFGKPIESLDSVGYYALLTFGLLIFMVAGLSLPQLLTLKVAGIELEKKFCGSDNALRASWD